MIQYPTGRKTILCVSVQLNGLVERLLQKYLSGKSQSTTLSRLLACHFVEIYVPVLILQHIGTKTSRSRSKDVTSTNNNTGRYLIVALSMKHQQNIQ